MSSSDFKKDEQQWLCPVCSLKKMKYGYNCEFWDNGFCENPPNINGQWYNNVKQTQDVQSIGIGAISDE